MPGKSTVKVSLEAPLQPKSAFTEATSSSGGSFPQPVNHSEYAANQNGQKVSAATLQAKGPTLDTLAAFNLPEPAIFNRLSAESRANVLTSLPVIVKCEYLDRCLSYALDGKENGASQFKAAIERPSSDLDLRKNGVCVKCGARKPTKKSPESFSFDDTPFTQEQEDEFSNMYCSKGREKDEKEKKEKEEREKKEREGRESKWTEATKRKDSPVTTGLDNMVGVRKVSSDTDVMSRAKQQPDIEKRGNALASSNSSSDSSDSNSANFPLDSPTPFRHFTIPPEFLFKNGPCMFIKNDSDPDPRLSETSSSDSGRSSDSSSSSSSSSDSFDSFG